MSSKAKIEWTESGMGSYPSDNEIADFVEKTINATGSKIIDAIKVINETEYNNKRGIL